MNLDEFDDILKQKLEEIPMQDAVPDWDRMNRALEEDSMKDQMFDEQVKRKLGQIDVLQYAKSNWNSLYELIDKRIQDKRRVLLAKTFEMLMVILLLFTAGNIGVELESNNQNATSDKNIAPMIASLEGETTENNLASAKSLAFASAEFSTNNDVIVIDEVAKNTSLKLLTINQVDDILHNEVAVILTPQLDSPLSAESTVSTISETILLAESTSSNQEIKISLMENKDEAMMAAAFPRDFSSLELKNMTPVEILSANTRVLPQLSMSKINKPSRYFITAEGGTRLHSIESAVHKSISNSRQSPQLESVKTSFNSYAALKVGYDFGRLDIVSGVGIERINYNPGLILATGDLSSIQETSIENIRYDFVSVPLEVRMNVFQHGSWTSQVQLGFITNLLMSAKETFSQKIYRGNRISTSDPDDIDPGIFKYDFQEGYLTDVVQEDKPSFRSSLTYKAMIGVNISKQMNNSGTSIFGGADYIYQLPSYNNLIDNNIDFINSFSLSVGVKQTLG